MQSNLLKNTLSVHSQLVAQLLVYLGSTRDCPDYEAMPGRNINLPPYYDHDLGRSPRKLYIPPVVSKQVSFNTLPLMKPSHKIQLASYQKTGLPAADFHRQREYLADKVLCKHESVAWKDEIQYAKPQLRALVYGSPGQGKSWLSQNTASEIAHEAYHKLKTQTKQLDHLVLPLCTRVDILIRKCATFASADEQSINVSHVRKAIYALYKEIRVLSSKESYQSQLQTPHLAHYLEQHVHEERFWLILDALDEYNDDDADVRLEEFFRAIALWRTCVVVTAREYAIPRFKQALHTHNVSVIYQLQDLSREASQAYVDRWFQHPDAIAPNNTLRTVIKHPQFANIAKSPSLLTLFCVLASDSKAEPLGPKFRYTDLYNSMLESLFRSSQRFNDLPSVCYAEAVKELTQIADVMLQTTSPSRPSISLTEILRIIDQNDQYSKQRLKLYQRLGILIPETHTLDSNWVFNHNELAAFFAGRYLADDHNLAMTPVKSYQSNTARDLNTSKDIETYLLRRIWQPEWERIIAFFLGHCQHPDMLLEALYDPKVLNLKREVKGIDILRYKLCATARLIQECDPKLYRTPRVGHKEKVKNVLTAIVQNIIEFWLKQIDKYKTGVWGGVTKNVLPTLIKVIEEQDLNVPYLPINILIDFLDNEERTIRFTAVEALAAIAAWGGDVSAAIAVLANILKDEESSTREFAAWGLGLLAANGADMSEVILHLTQNLESEDRIIRSSTTEVLNRFSAAGVDISQAVTSFGDLLEHKDEAIRSLSVKQIGKAAEAGEDLNSMLPILADKLGHKYSRVRTSAAEALGEITAGKIDMSEVIPRLIINCNDSNDKVSMSALRTLGVMSAAGEDVSTAIIPFIKGLKHKNWSVIYESQWNLQFFAEAGGKAEVAAKPLIYNLKHENDHVRYSAAETLSVIAVSGVNCTEAIAPLIDALKGNIRMRYAAALALSAISEGGGDIREAITPLIQNLDNEEEPVRYAATKALQSIAMTTGDVKEAVRPLINKLNTKDWLICDFPVETIRCIVSAGGDINETIKPLIQKLNHENSNVWFPAAEAIGVIATTGADVNQAITLLINALGDIDESFDKITITSLAQILSRANLEETTRAIQRLFDIIHQSTMPQKRSAAARVLDQLSKEGFRFLQDSMRKYRIFTSPQELTHYLEY